MLQIINLLVTLFHFFPLSGYYYLCKNNYISKTGHQREALKRDINWKGKRKEETAFRQHFSLASLNVMDGINSFKKVFSKTNYPQM